ncbi:MAG: hypothetical protein ACK4ZS_02560 [Sulfurimicrobium sp.]
MNPSRNVSIMCFHDELCQVFNALMTALSLLRNGPKVTIFFRSRGVLAVHKAHVGNLSCMPDMPKKRLFEQFARVAKSLASAMSVANRPIFGGCSGNAAGV